MQKIVLVALGRLAAARACLDVAGYSAGVLRDARIVALTTHVAPETSVLPSEEVLTARHRAELEHRANDEIAALKGVFADWRGERGLEAEWIEAVGTAQDEVARRGQTAELVIAAAPTPHEDSAGLRAALFGTNRPVIVVPDRLGPSVGRNIAIAWHEDEPAAKAVLAAMPYLAAAERVWVLEASRTFTRGAAPGMPPVLRDHRIAAELRVVAAGRDVGTALLDEVHALGADLVIMGAYAHNPLVESVIGGVTRTVLHKADIPVLLQH
jgi:nucleotide-binding universal stress UspA family protein